VPDLSIDSRAFGKSVMAVVEGDITRFPADAIVNAANNAFAPGGGVDGAIRRAGGPELSGEMRRRYPTGTPTGTAVWTDAYLLPAKWVIHAVGPVWGGGGMDKIDLLAEAYRNSLRIGEELGVRTIAMPAVSAGIFGFPADTAADVTLRTVADHIVGETGIERVTFVLRGEGSRGVPASAGDDLRNQQRITRFRDAPVTARCQDSWRRFSAHHRCRRRARFGGPTVDCSPREGRLSWRVMSSAGPHSWPQSRL
jgi:O-acetyl-ADP-ribose deacetylase (regulator of RNase III)